MTATDDDGALRTAGQLLTSAQERITVVGVGAPHGTSGAGVPFGMTLGDLQAVDVRYRLAGTEHRGTIVLGRLAGTHGWNVDDWRVVVPLTGTVDWEKPGFADAATDDYVGGLRLERRPELLGTDEEDVQPLYPAVYGVQARLDPYFASTQAPVAVPAGKPTPPPKLGLEPTPRTKARIRQQVLALIKGCGARSFERYMRCPLTDIVGDEGVDALSDSHRWWRGLTAVPAVKVDGWAVTVSGGSFRFAAPDGVRTVSFHGTGRTVIDNQSWKPFVLDLELEEGSR